MKKIIALAAIISLILFIGCTTPLPAGDGTLVADGTANGTGGTTEENGGTVTGTVTGDDWCPAGSTWNWSAAGEQGVNTALTRILGKEMYNGIEMCHVMYETTGTQTPEGVIIEYYFTQGETEVYFVIKDAQGNIIQETQYTGGE